MRADRIAAVVYVRMGREFHGRTVADGAWSTFVTRPISGTLIALASLSLAAPYLISLARRRPKPAMTDDV